MSDLIDKNKAMLVLYDVCKEHKHREPLHTVLADAEARISHLETCTEDELYEEGVQDERARWRKLCSTTPNTELEDRVWALETELKAVKLRENAKSDILRKLVDRFFLDYGNKYFKSLIDACTPEVIDIS